MAPSAGASGPLACMQALSPTVAFWDPGQQLHTQTRPPSSKHPELILLLSWMAARDEHIAKYIMRHRALFPTSRILLIRCPLSRVWLPRIARRDMRPALPLLQALAGRGDGRDDDERRPRVLVHMFSNGGVSTAVHLRAMLLAAGPDDCDRSVVAPPRYVLLLDSCPGYFRWRNTHRALGQTLPWWASPLMHVAIANAREVRSPWLVSNECQRTYLYGTADNIVDYQDVEDNARKAEQVGFSVRLERFEGATHVAMAKFEPARYWGAVRESWESWESWESLGEAPATVDKPGLGTHSHGPRFRDPREL